MLLLWWALVASQSDALRLCGRVQRRQLLRSAAAGLSLAKTAPACAAAAAPKAVPEALDVASAYALVRASDGGIAVTLDLDRSGRVRSAAYFYETVDQASAVLRALAKLPSRKKAAPLAVARVPLSEVVARTLEPPRKEAGFPGYYCSRLLLEPSRRAAALRATGLDDLGDRSLPLFYVDDARGTRGESGVAVDAFWDPAAADKASDAANRAKRTSKAEALYAREADLYSLLKQPEALETIVNLIPSAMMIGDASRAMSGAYDAKASPELVLELECDPRTSRCAVAAVAPPSSGASGNK